MSTVIPYTDAELDAQYNARAAVPEHVDIMAEWEQRSEALRASRPCRLDLAYGDGPRATLDLFSVAEAEAPVHVYIHGGYWQRGDKRIYSCVAESLLQRGINVALVGYDLCPAVDLDHIVAQIRGALAWLWRSAAKLGVDRGCIQLCGHSAGGHLTAMALAVSWAELGEDLPSQLVQSAVAISGLYDLAPLVRTSVNDAVGLDEDSARRNSPALLSPASRAPLVVAVGGLESDEFHRQARALVSAWKPHGVPVELLEVPDTNHFTIVDTLAREGMLLERAVGLLASPP